jgi:flagellar export protein FliJ
MPRRDPLAVLALVRGLARDAARQQMTAAEARLGGATAAATAVEVAFAAEMQAAGADYAAWLPAAQRNRQRAAGGVRRAEAGVEAARAALVGARAEAEAVDQLLAARRRAARLARRAAEQALLDDLPRAR